MPTYPNVNPRRRETVPQLTSIAPSIFVPMQSDLTAPIELPTGRLDRIRKVLETVEVHSAAVKANILHMFDIEIGRNRREAKERERANWEPLDNDVGITREDFERMVQNVEGVLLEPRNYHATREIPKPQYDMNMPARTLREDYARKVLNLVEAAIEQVEGYAAHSKLIRAQYRKALEESL